MPPSAAVGLERSKWFGGAANRIKAGCGVPGICFQLLDLHRLPLRHIEDTKLTRQTNGLRKGDVLPVRRTEPSPGTISVFSNDQNRRPGAIVKAQAHPSVRRVGGTTPVV